MLLGGWSEKRVDRREKEMKERGRLALGSEKVPNDRLLVRQYGRKAVVVDIYPSARPAIGRNVGGCAEAGKDAR